MKLEIYRRMKKDERKRNALDNTLFLGIILFYLTNLA